MNDKKGLIVGLVIVAALFAVAAPYGRLVMVKLDVQDAVLKLGRHPDPALIIALKDKLTKIPTKYFVKESAVKTTVAVEERDMGSAGIWRFVVTKVDFGKVVEKEHRFETSVSETFFEELREGGIPVTRLGAHDDD